MKINRFYGNDYTSGPAAVYCTTQRGLPKALRINVGFQRGMTRWVSQESPNSRDKQKRQNEYYRRGKHALGNHSRDNSGLLAIINSILQVTYIIAR